MHILSAKEVRTKINSNRDVKLIMVLGEAAFKRAHIPGSLNISDVKVAEHSLAKDSTIIVYCSDIECSASFHAYRELVKAGYIDVYRFAGGLVEWDASGFALARG